MDQLRRFNTNFTEEELAKWIQDNLELSSAQKRKIQGTVADLSSRPHFEGVSPILTQSSHPPLVTISLIDNMVKGHQLHD